MNPQRSYVLLRLFLSTNPPQPKKGECKRKRAVIIVAVITVSTLLILLSLSVSTEAQEINNGSMNGTIETFNVVVSVGNVEAKVLTTSDKETFVVTQFCSFYLDLQLRGSILGWIPVPGAACTTFSPGIALPPGEELFCTRESSDWPKSCLVTGVWVKVTK